MVYYSKYPIRPHPDLRVVALYAKPGKYAVKLYLSGEFDPPPMTHRIVREFDNYETAQKYRNWCWSMPSCHKYYR